tara:strand:+ start:12560 stop:13642 length:1083 start_codon:yes stop_codon:yes gene_type:complete
LATFETQIENLTKIDIGTSEQPMVTQWLRDGVREIVNRVSTISPGDMVKFTTTTVSSSNDSLVVNGKILSVMRNQFIASDNKLRKADIIDTSQRYNATDKDSLSYRSAYNPGYYILNGTLNVVPDPSTSDFISLTQIAYDQELTYASESVEHFPYEYEHLVPLYASIKLIFRQFSVVEEEMGVFNAPALPNAPSVLESEGNLNQYITPQFTSPTFSHLDFVDTNNWISVEEDSEMLAARMSEIDGKMKEFQLKLELEKTKFEEANNKFQADLQIEIENIRSKNDKGARDIQLYSQEVAEYEQEVVKEVQRFQYEVITKSTKKYEWLGSRYSALLKDYNDAFALMGNLSSKQQSSNQGKGQ